MKTSLKRKAAIQTSSGEIAGLRTRLANAEETLRAICSGEVDTFAVQGRKGPLVFTLHGAEHAYRMLIETMNEGALTLTADKMILYANQCFARMIKCPLERVTGTSFRRFLSTTDQAILKPLMRRVTQTGSKIQVLLHAEDGSQIPAQISIRKMAKNGFNRVTIGMVVTDMTEARRTEELLRALTHRVVQVQEDERGRVALELHDNITQLLCAVIFRSQALVETLSVSSGPSRKEALSLRKMLGETAEEVERISRNLRPSVFEQLGLVAVLREAGREFAERTGVLLKLECVQLSARLPADTELTLYRILQEALHNVQMHAHARHVTVSLTQQGSLVHLTIKDDGVGYNQDLARKDLGGKEKLGLLNMRERAIYVGGTLKIKSGRSKGTEIEVSIPMPPVIAAVFDEKMPLHHKRRATRHSAKD